MTGRQRIVVGVDGSPASLAALEWALDEALRRDAVVEAVSAWDFPAEMAPYLLGGDASPERAVELARDTVRSAVAEARAAAPRFAGVDVEEVAVVGPAGVALLARADHADLLVVGSRGRTALRSKPLGSVGRECVDHVACPVVVVRPPSEHADERSGAGDRLGPAA